MQIIRKVGNRWGLSKHSIDMMNKLNVIVKNITRGPIIMVLLNWFSKSHGNLNRNMMGLIPIGWTLTPLYLLSP